MAIHSRESDITKKKILHAAKKEFAAHGYGGARMSSIAAIAGVNQSLLHYHFSGKEKIYKETIRNLLKNISGIYSERIINEIDSWNVSPDLKLCAAIYVLVNSELYIRDDEFHKIIAHEIAEGKGIIHAFIREYLLPQLMSVEDILKDGISDGIFEISNTAMFSLNIISLIKDVANGEEFLRDSDLYDYIYQNRYETLFDYMLEFSFKSLRPEGKDLKIPDLDRKRKNILDAILKDMRDEVINF